MLSISLKELENKAIELKELLDREIQNKKVNLDIEDSYSEVGGGSLPLEKIPTKCIVLSIENSSIQELENNLRKHEIPIIVRLYKDKIYMDLRTIKRQEFNIVVKGVSFALERLKGEY